MSYIGNVTVSGRIIDTNGDPVPNLRITPMKYDSPLTSIWNLGICATTSATGEYSFSVESTTAYTIVAIDVLIDSYIPHFIVTSSPSKRTVQVTDSSYIFTNQDFVVTLVPHDYEYCLTSTVAYAVGGSVRIPIDTSSYCEADGVSPVSCAQNYPEGSEVSCTCEADSGWEVSKWELRSNNSLTTGSILLSQTGGTTFNLTMPSQNAFLFVYFKRPNVSVILQVDGAVNGLIDLQNPSGYTIGPSTEITTSIPYGTGKADAIAYPSTGYQVQKWTVNGTIQSGTSNTLQFSLDTSPVTVVVYFEPVAVCDKYRLTVTVEGRGTVYPSTDDYCRGSTQILTPTPAGSSRFKGWVYNESDSDIVLDGITLHVTMNSAKSVKAIFEDLEIITGVIPSSPNVFYCPSEDYRSHLIAFNYTNDNNPSYPTKFHFRVNFYTDSSKMNLVYTVFSLIDNKRWYYDDGGIHIFPPDGMSVLDFQTVRIIFDPEVLPISLMEYQKEEAINGSNPAAFEIPLACGAKYFVDIQAYEVGGDFIEIVQSLSMIVDCDDVGAFYWSKDVDTNKWFCSGQGKMDLKVSDSSDQSVYGGLSSNIFGLFRIVWQGKRGLNNAIYGATWDSEEDILYGSGQGLFDKNYIATGLRPLILTDQANNFYVAAHHKTDIGYYGCPEEVFIPETVTPTEDSAFADVCFPGEAVYLGTSFGDVKIRLYEKDQEGSLTISRDKAIPVVTKQSLRFDISGIDGAYAVKMRDAEDPDWSEWMVIDDASNEAIRIDNSRFIIPWKIDRINGVRRICCRILTLYGISRTFCTEVFFNKADVEYVFKFYNSSSRSEDSQVRLYNGMPVLTGNGTKVYFSVIFSEEVDYTALTFNFIQQGIDDVYGASLTKVSNTRFDGEITIYKHDGVFSRDGKAFIQVVFPDQIGFSSCGSDTQDPYNLMINNVDAERYQNSSPEEVYKAAVASKINKAITNVQPFKQYYDTDDSNFKFGSPDFFRND